jgi:hypothetical protein
LVGPVDCHPRLRRGATDQPRIAIAGAIARGRPVDGTRDGTQRSLRVLGVLSD